MNYLGKKLRELRESQGLLLRQVAAQIDVDTAFLSKMERGDRKAQREHVSKLARLLKTDEDELIVLWLADKLKEVIDDEPLASKALELIEKENK
jgi:transcriptional regulator with XRE-family HTH domain